MIARKHRFRTGLVITIIIVVGLLLLNLITIIYVINNNSNKKEKSEIFLTSKDNIDNKDNNPIIIKDDSLQKKENNTIQKNNIEYYTESNNHRNGNIDAKPPIQLDRTWINNSEIANPSNLWMDIYGNITIDGNLAEGGDKIGAFDSNGILIGIYTVKNTGKYGFMHVYSNNINNNNFKLKFLIYDKSRDKVIEASSVDVYWNLYDKKLVELNSVKYMH